jgi:hypothetical protein
MIESVLDQRHAQEGHEFADGTHAGVAHVLWTEYVVERTRRGIANEPGWGYGALEQGLIVEPSRDFQTNCQTSSNGRSSTTPFRGAAFSTGLSWPASMP